MGRAANRKRAPAAAPPRGLVIPAPAPRLTAVAPATAATAASLRAALTVPRVAVPVAGTDLTITVRKWNLLQLVSRGVINSADVETMRSLRGGNFTLAYLDVLNRIACTVIESPAVVLDEQAVTDEAIWVQDLPLETKINIVNICSGVQDTTPNGSLAPYVPTPRETVKQMLALAGVTESDLLYDLGCGDGRIVVGAAKQYGARGVGIDFNPERITAATMNAKLSRVEHLVEFLHQDILQADVSPATVVTLYLLQHSNLKIRDSLIEHLQPGARVVSHDFSMGEWEADATEEHVDQSGKTHRLYLWRL